MVAVLALALALGATVLLVVTLVGLFALRDFIPLILGMGPPPAERGSAQAKHDGWRRAAERHGLRNIGGADVFHLVGKVDGMHLEVRVVVPSDSENDSWTASPQHTWVRVTGLPEGLDLAQTRSLRARIDGAESEDVVLGDPPFDRRFWVHGRPQRVLTLLDAPAREALMRLPSTVAIIREGALEVRWSRRVERDLDEQLLRVRAATRALQRASERGAERLAEAVQSDPLHTVRANALRALAAVDLEAARALTSTLPPDADVELRFAAAQVLGDLDTLVRLVQHDQHDAALRVDALCHVCRSHPDGRDDALVAALGSDSADLVSAALQLMVDAEIKNLGGHSSERVLLKHLRTAPPSIRIELIQAIGVFGTAAAVEPLMEVRDAGLMADALSEAAAQAIATIQSRLGGHNAGALSIAQPAGALSEAAPDKRGALSRAQRRTNS